MQTVRLRASPRAPHPPGDIGRSRAVRIAQHIFQEDSPAIYIFGFIILFRNMSHAAGWRRTRGQGCADTRQKVAPK
jgi:hypothetical protein